MEKEEKEKDCEEKCHNAMRRKHWRGHKHGGSAVYGLGFLGAAVYFISTATGFWIGVLGVLKAIVWPAILIYQALQYLAR